jgi:hypothetical protein
MKTIVLSALLFLGSLCKAQNVLGPSVVTWGGSAGYSFDPNRETYLWGTWVNVELNRRKSITPLLGLGMLSWNTPGVNDRYFLPQVQVGIVTKGGLVAYYGLTTDYKHHSIGLGFYAGYQQFRIEYIETLKSISFGCGYILK